MKKEIILVFIFSIIMAADGFSQARTFRIIKGTIISSHTGEVIPYVNLALSNSSINSMTNENGQFILKIPENRLTDSIDISHVGYRPIKILFNPADSGISIIRMTEAETRLTEVVIKTINPLELLKKAIRQIPDNYPSTPYRISGFYRLTGTKEKRIIDLSEAVFEIYYESLTGKNSQFKLIKSRVDKDLTAFNGSDMVSIGLDPAAVMGSDRLRDLKSSGFLSDKGLQEHQFSFKGLINYNGQQAYEISFDQRDGLKKSLYKGKILLDADNLAFLEFDIRLSPKGIKYYDWGFVMKLMLNLARVKAEMLAENAIITYRKFGSKYYLNHVNSTGLIYLAGGNRHFLFDPLVNKINFLVTGIDTADVKPFPKEEIMRSKGMIESRSKVINDTKDSPDHSDTADRFWENYNLIQADYNVDSAVRIIQQHNVTLNFKNLLEHTLSDYGKDKSVRIDSILSFYYRNGQFNGTALVQYKDKLVFEKGFGYADKELKRRNNGQTKFRIGSTSKQFTAMLIMQLVSQKKMSVRDTVGKFIPGFVHGQVTIQQLLTHQSGIPNYTANPDYLLKIISKTYSPDELVYQFCSDSLEFEPGSQFHYSNSGYVVLADIIEKLTGKKYAEVLSEEIFKPLEMNNSFFVSGGTEHDLATGYINGEPEKAYPVENVIGAGGITSTADDLLIWANALSTDKILSGENRDELFLPRVEWKEWDAYYGYGWMVDRSLFQASKKHTVQYHPGTEFGFFDMLVRQPDNGIVVILLNNTGDFPRFDMTDLILNQLN